MLNKILTDGKKYYMSLFFDLDNSLCFINIV